MWKGAPGGFCDQNSLSRFANSAEEFSSKGFSANRTLFNLPHKTNYFCLTVIFLLYSYLL